MGRVKPHLLTQEDIDWIHKTGQGGRDGILIQLIPLLEDEAIENAGAKIAQVLHSTPRIQKTAVGSDKKAGDYSCFEMWMTNKKANMYLWAKDQHQLQRVLEQYRVCYPGMGFEQTEQYFPTLKENQHVCVARLQYTQHWTYPLKIIENGQGWKEILGATATDQPDQTVIIQIIMKPLKRSKSWKGKTVAYKRKQIRDSPDTPYSRLTDLISSKADQPPFYVEIRAAVMGNNPTLTVKKMENILGAFQPFSSGRGGNKLKPVANNIGWRAGLNAVEDRDITHFVTQLDYRMRMGADELGHNFLSIPVDGGEPLQYTHVWKREIPGEIEKKWTDAPTLDTINPVKVQLTTHQLTPAEVEEMKAEILQREIEEGEEEAQAREQRKREKQEQEGNKGNVAYV